MPTHTHQAGVTRIQKSMPICQKICLFTHISTWQVATAKYNKQPPRVVIKFIDTMALNIKIKTRKQTLKQD